MRCEYEISIRINHGDSDTIVKISKDRDSQEQNVSFIGECSLTSDEMAMVAIINETLARITNGKMVNYEADLPSFSSQNEVIKCEWLPRTGNLKVHGSTENQYHFVERVEDAVAERRTFTCPRRLVSMLPKNKGVQANG